MSVFYMEDCLNDNESLEYFESIFLPIQELIRMEKLLLMELEKHIIDENEQEDMDSEIVSIDKLKELRSSLIDYILSLLRNSIKIKKYKDEQELFDAYLSLISSYKDIYDESYEKIVLIMEKEYEKEEDMILFNSLLQSSNNTLEESLRNFYKFADVFGDKYDISLD